MRVATQVFVMAVAFAIVLAGAGPAQAQPAGQVLIYEHGASAQCLDVQERDGTVYPVIRTCSSGRAEQRWLLRQDDLAYFGDLIVNEASGLCLKTGQPPGNVTSVRVTPYLTDCPPVGPYVQEVWQWTGVTVGEFTAVRDHDERWLVPDGENVVADPRPQGPQPRWKYGDVGRPTKPGGCGIRACPSPEDS